MVTPITKIMSEAIKLKIPVTTSVKAARIQADILFTFPKRFRLFPEVSCLREPDSDEPDP
jgi:hypothetical protein